MSQELHYTSVPRGLKPGSRGFGTVAATAGLPEAMADRLEALSAYRAVYPPGDPSEALNPVAYVHARLTVAGYVQDVLSRIGPAGLDYSGRPNKYAHHIILEPDERPDAGPAWLLSQPGFVRESWEGEPRILAEGVPVPRGDRPAGIARAWHDLTGDAGWAGVLAESFLADPRRPVFLVFRPGMELLPLFAEAIALLPASRRWDVEFSTYLTTLPPGISCNWRGVLDGSPELKGARRLPNAMILDLGRPPGRAQGGGLVHLARTGERIDTPDAAVAPPSANGPARPPAMTAGPPPRPRTARPVGGEGGRDWLPDLAARLAEDDSLLGGEATRRRRRPRSHLIALVIAAGLVPMLAAILLSPALRRGLGLEAAPIAVAVAAGDHARPPTVAKRVEPPIEKPPAEPAPPAEPEKKAGPVAEAKAKAKAPPTTDVAKPEIPPVRPPAEPLLLAFAPPGRTPSAFGKPEQQAPTLSMPVETEDRLEIRNGDDFRLTAVPGAPHTWEVAPKTGSGLGGGFALARLTHADGRTWRFVWTKDARARSSPVEGLKDAILQLQGRDGRPIYVLLRGVELDNERPLEVWKDQRILFDKLDTRNRSVGWAGDSDAIEGSRWKPRILRWKLVLSRAVGAAKDGDPPPPRRVFEPDPAGDAQAPGAGPSLERDLIPGEVKLKLSIDPTRPGEIDVRVEQDPDKVQAGRRDRASRLEDLKKATPRDKDGQERDPLEYRRARLRKLRDDGGRNGDEIKTLEKEVADLERIARIRGTEDLLTRLARVELSVVIGLDVEGPGVLEIVRIGEFARGR